MKVAVVSESPADEAAIRILANEILGELTVPVTLVRVRPRGWTEVVRLLPTIVRQLHYHSDADGLIVVVDSDRSPVHMPDHDQPESEPKNKCRLCSLRYLVQKIRNDPTPVTGRGPLKIGSGLAVPAIEAWYRCGMDPHISEMTWINSSRTGKYPCEVKQLKKIVYETSRPILGHETARAAEEARRIVDQQKLGQLEQLFPNGFGPLAAALRSW